MAITFFDKEGNIIVLPDREDKPYWYTYGEDEEQNFINFWGEQNGYAINPEKKYNKSAPDLVYTSNGNIVDLKSQHFPFFTAGKYRLEPQYTVVFNVKDEKRYKEHYPDIDILFYIDWIAVKANINGRIYQINPYMGIYSISFSKLQILLKDAPIHEYINRRYDDRGNAKASYLLNIRNPMFTRLV